jgi:AcrR family transcriptional regulator
MAETRTAILDSAERLFAARGVDGVSVRAVLADAGANVALAHYYFGSRDGLIRDVLRRRTEPLNAERLRRLDQVEAAAGPHGPPIEAVLRAFFAPAIDLLSEHPDFARLLGQMHVAYTPAQRQVFLELFESVLPRFSNAIKRALPPGLSGAQIIGRAHFMLGALILTLTNYSDLELMARGRFDAPRGEALLEELVTFCAAGLTAPPDARASAAS